MEKESSGSLLEPGPILVSSLDLGAHDLVDEDYKLTELRPLQEPFFEKLLDECEIKDDTGEEEDEDKPVCDGCSLEFTSKLALGQHLKESKECGSSCRSCGWTFTSKLLLHKHRLEFHAKGDKVKEELSDFVDLGCVKLESDGFEMAEEETTAVVAQEYFEPVERATTENIQIITAFMCDQCSLVFSTEALLLDHKKLHTHPFVICPGEFASKIYFVKDLQFLTDDNYECDKCDATFKEKHLLDAHRPLHDLVYACEHCDAKFKEEAALVKHRTRHRVVFRCDVCDAAFKEEGLLVKHKIIHTDPKPFKCSQCGAAFRLKYYLTRHQAIHTGMKPFQCGYCGKHFRQKAHLKKHERIHTGEKPYKCDQCEAAYSDSYHLKLHKVVHSGETPFKCFHCEQGFREKPALRKHMKNHIKAQVCEACGEGFADYAQLKEHKRNAHIGERPFKCDQCPVSFVQESSLIVHKRRHAGEKPYQCSRCKKGFSKKYRLVNHEKTTLCLPKRVHILDPV